MRGIKIPPAMCSLEFARMFRQLSKADIHAAGDKLRTRRIEVLEYA